MLRFRSLDRAARYSLAAGLILSLLAGIGAWTAPTAAAAPPAAPGPQDTVQYFPQTSHLVRGALLTFFQQTGGLNRFGPPLTEQYEEGGHLYQIFERGGLIYDPASGAVAARALGAELVAGRPVDPPVVLGPNGPDGVYVTETGHTIGRAFVAFWQGHDGWNRLGKPISEQLSANVRVSQ